MVFFMKFKNFLRNGHQKFKNLTSGNLLFFAKIRSWPLKYKRIPKPVLSIEVKKFQKYGQSFKIMTCLKAIILKKIGNPIIKVGFQ